MRVTTNHAIAAMAALLFSCAAVAVSPSETHGAQISFTLEGSRTVAPSTVASTPAPPADLLFAVSGQLHHLAMVVPDDWDRALNYQIGDPPSLALVIRDDNAAALGFDLDAFENGLENSHSLDLRFRGTSGNMSAPDNISSAIFRSGQVIDVPGWRLVDIEVEEMRVNVDYYFWHSILTGLRTAKISFEIDASGRIVPEPAAFVLGLLAVAGMAAVIGRRAR